MPPQFELDRIWKDICDGKYGTDPTISKPTKVVDDAVEQVMNVPGASGVGAKQYRRTPGKPWEEVPYVGHEQPFR